LAQFSATVSSFMVIFLCCSSCVQSTLNFYMADVNILLLVNYIMHILTDKYFITVFWVAKSYMAICFNYFLSNAIFLNTDISQGSVSTYTRCGGIFTDVSVANLPLNLSAKEFWKSANISGSYGQEFSVLFFGLTV